MPRVPPQPECESYRRTRRRGPRRSKDMHPATMYELAKLRIAEDHRQADREGIVLTSAGGSNIEHHGEFAVSIEDDEDPKKMQRAMDLLKGFHPHIADVKVCWLVPGASGQLLACIEEARNEDRFAGLRVRDVAITTERNDQGEVAVQVFFEGRR